MNIYEFSNMRYSTGGQIFIAGPEPHDCQMLRNWDNTSDYTVLNDIRFLRQFLGEYLPTPVSSF